MAVTGPAAGPAASIAGPAALGLPGHIAGCLFDLDGVLTPTASVHARAWKQAFDEFLAELPGPTRAAAAFDPVADYARYVDGLPRIDGARSFLAARRIVVPAGSAADPPRARTLHGIANRKNDILLGILRRDGIAAYPGSVRYLCAVRAVGLPCGVVSSSANCSTVLAAAGIERLFDARVDGLVTRWAGLAGKPEPDSYLAGARALGVRPAEAAVFEDAVAGVVAAVAGGFGFVVGVDHAERAHTLAASGAHVVVDDLARLLSG